MPCSVLQSVSEHLDALLDLSPKVGPARFQRYKEAAAAREAAREAEHTLQVSRLQDDLQRSRAQVHQLQQQLDAAQAQLQRQQQ